MLPGLSHRKRCSPRAETVHTLGLDSSYLVFQNWYAGMMYGIYSYLVTSYNMGRTRVVFSHKIKIKHISS